MKDKLSLLLLCSSSHVCLLYCDIYLCYHRQVKCHQYWPEGDETLTFGNLEIICTKIRDFSPSYIYREMYVTDSKVRHQNCCSCKWSVSFTCQGGFVFVDTVNFFFYLVPASQIQERSFKTSRCQLVIV